MYKGGFDKKNNLKNMEIKYRLHDKEGKVIGYEIHKKNEHGCFQIYQTSVREDWSDGDTKNVREGYFIAATHKCKYLSITDKNGQQICEGDVVFDEDSSSRNKIAYDEATSAYVISGFRNEWDDWLHNFPSNKLEVLGNIYSNPELIK